LNATNFARLTIRATYSDLNGAVLTPGLFFMPMAETCTPNGNVIRHFDIPIKIPATCDVKVSAYSDAGSSVVECTLRGWTE